MELRNTIDLTFNILGHTELRIHIGTRVLNTNHQKDIAVSQNVQGIDLILEDHFLMIIWMEMKKKRRRIERTIVKEAIIQFMLVRNTRMVNML